MASVLVFRFVSQGLASLMAWIPNGQEREALSRKRSVGAITARHSSATSTREAPKGDGAYV